MLVPRKYGGCSPSSASCDLEAKQNQVVGIVIVSESGFITELSLTSMYKSLSNTF